MKAIHQNDPRLTAYALGELEPSAVEKFERLMGADPSAAGTVEEILEVSSLLQHEFSREPGLFLTAEQRSAILKGKVPARHLDRPLPWSVETFPRDAAGGGRTAGRGRNGARRSALVMRIAAATTAAAAVVIAAATLHRAIRIETPERGDGAFASLFPDQVRIHFGTEEDPSRSERSEIPSSAGEDGGVLWSSAVTPSDSMLDYPIPDFDAALGSETEPAGQWAAAGGEVDLSASDLRGSDTGPRFDVPGWIDDRVLHAAPFFSGASLFSSEQLRRLTAVPAEFALIPSAGEAVPSPAYSLIPFLLPLEKPVSVIARPGDPSAYANVRHVLTGLASIPPRNMAGPGDIVNHFDYAYRGPEPASSNDDPELPIGADVEIAECPWAVGHLLVRVGLKAAEPPPRPGPRRVALLLDASALSMGAAERAVLNESLKSVTGALREDDRVSAVAFGGGSYFVLEPTEFGGGAEVGRALDAFAASSGDGSGRSPESAAALTRRFLAEPGQAPAANSAVIALAASAGPAEEGGRPLAGALASLAASAPPSAPVQVIGVGRAILGEASLDDLAESGFEFRYAGSIAEARRAMREAMESARIPAAEDVVAQVEFNPAAVRAYRPLGDSSFGGATVEARIRRGDHSLGAVAAGEQLTVIYEIIPAPGYGGERRFASAAAEPLRYGAVASDLTAAASRHPGGDELLTVRITGVPAGQNGHDRTAMREIPVSLDSAPSRFNDASEDFRFAAAAAGFGLLLAEDAYSGSLSLESVISIAKDASGDDPFGLRREFVELVRVTSELGR